MYKRQVVVTGMGLVSPLSLSLESFWNSLVAGESGLRPFAPLHLAAPTPFTGDIDDFGDLDAAQKKAIKKSLKVMSREIQLAVAATCRALHSGGVTFGQLPATRVGVSFGSDYIVTTPEEFTEPFIACLRQHVPGTAVSKELYDRTRWALDGLPKMTPLWQLKYLPNMPASHIAILNAFHGPSNSITLREASVGAVVGEAAAIIAENRADAMLVGTTGSRLHPVKLVHALLNEELSPELCRPFDRNRQGTLLGEGAGALFLEERNHAEKRGATIYAEVLAASYRIGFETVQNKSGTLRNGKRVACQKTVERVLRDLLRQSRLEPEEIGHVSAHGLGSRWTDAEEATAIQNVFGGRKTPIPVCAMKGFWGNLGAGSGTIELIGSILALRHRHLYPSLNVETPDPTAPVSVTNSGDMPSGSSFVKLAISPQGQVSGVLLKAV